MFQKKISLLSICIICVVTGHFVIYFQNISAQYTYLLNNVRKNINTLSPIMLSDKYRTI